MYCTLQSQKGTADLNESQHHQQGNSSHGRANDGIFSVGNSSSTRNGISKTTSITMADDGVLRIIVADLFILHCCCWNIFCLVVSVTFGLGSPSFPRFHRPLRMHLSVPGVGSTARRGVSRSRSHQCGTCKRIKSIIVLLSITTLFFYVYAV